uniref:Uncharacterized protein n=1 Tax=Arundo donax TaxID=35708 RepID=A0A0A9GU14_ARUDO
MGRRHPADRAECLCPIPDCMGFFFPRTCRRVPCHFIKEGIKVNKDKQPKHDTHNSQIQHNDHTPYIHAIQLELTRLCQLGTTTTLNRLGEGGI